MRKMAFFLAVTDEEQIRSHLNEGYLQKTADNRK